MHVLIAALETYTYDSTGYNVFVCVDVVFQFDVDEFVASHLNDHRKGLLGRQLSAEALLTFSKALLFCHMFHLLLMISTGLLTYHKYSM